MRTGRSQKPVSRSVQGSTNAAEGRKPEAADTRASMRVAAVLEYDGSAFSGWQRQTRARSVQAVVEDAFSKIAGEPIEVTVAGRTDAGVHALGQVIHFDTSAERSGHSWVRGAVSNLPADVAVLWADRVDPAFHARYAATGRHYHYVVLNRPVRPGLLASRVTHDYRSLDVPRMQQAASYLLGEHDFNAYRSSECQAKNPVRELRALDVTQVGERIVIHAYANAFLHHMIRNIAGVLLAIGAGDKPPHWARDVLESRDRTLGGVTAPPDGLYLTQIEYPSNYNIPVLGTGTGLW